MFHFPITKTFSDDNLQEISLSLPIEIFKNKIIIRKIMKMKRGKTEDGGLKENHSSMENEEASFLEELDLDEDE